MRGRPDEEVLRELMAEMNEMDKERLGKKRHGPSITIAVGVPEGEGENKEMGEKESESMDQELAEAEGVPVPETPAMMEEGIPGEPMEEENELLFDDEEKALIEEAKALGIDDPEELDMRLLKKLIEKKKVSA